MRLDKYLFEQNLAKSRTKASDMISSGIVFVNGKKVTKASFEISPNDIVEIKGETLKYVSRGGLKLEAALDSFGIDVQGMVAIDFGASSGGFTDCLLKRGSKKVYAIDSGSNQLDISLRDNPSVISLENCNARYIEFDTIGELADIIVCDLSFISQTLIHEVVARFLSPDGCFVSLIKPQFEVGKENIGKCGIVKSDKARRLAIDRVTESAKVFGLERIALIESPIKGGDGNIEYLALFHNINNHI